MEIDGNTWTIHGQISRALRSDCFAMVLTAGFDCDSRAHNVRVVKYIVVYGQISRCSKILPQP